MSAEKFELLPERPRIAILASGSGSTAQRFIEDVEKGIIDAEVPLVMTNNPDAGVLQRVDAFNAAGHRIIKRIINNRTHPGIAGPGEQTAEAAEAMVRQLELSRISLVLMLGFMKKIVPPLVGGERPILNTHPGLLPASAGLHGIHVQEFAIEQGHEAAGQTLHLANHIYDNGKVIAVNIVPIRPDHTPETLFADVQVVEKDYIAPDVGAFWEAYRRGEHRE